MTQRLHLNNIELLVSIGIEEQEKLHKQCVILEIIIEPQKQITGCISDNIEDTTCYAKILTDVANISQSKHFNLIEHFTYSIYNYLAKSLEHYNIKVKATKKIKVNEIKSDAIFDFISDVLNS